MQKIKTNPGGYIAGTGHRPNKLALGKFDPYSEELYTLLVSFAQDQLEWFEPYMVYTGMALGWDQALAQAANNLGIRYTAIIPFNGQEEKWPTERQEYYNWLLSRADGVVYITDRYSPEAFLERNVWLVNNADLLLALYDGSARSGTGHCVRYAEKEGVPVENVWGQWEDLIMPPPHLGHIKNMNPINRRRGKIRS